MLRIQQQQKPARHTVPSCMDHRLQFPSNVGANSLPASTWLSGCGVLLFWYSVGRRYALKGRLN